MRGRGQVLAARVTGLGRYPLDPSPWKASTIWCPLLLLMLLCTICVVGNDTIGRRSTVDTLITALPECSWRKERDKCPRVCRCVSQKLVSPEEPQFVHGPLFAYVRVIRLVSQSSAWILNVTIREPL